jgi:hypothetical protein
MEVSLPDDALFAGNTIKLYGLFYANTGISTSGVYYKDVSG